MTWGSVTTTLGTDPYTGNRYAFTAGNPISRIELDGHWWGEDLWEDTTNWVSEHKTEIIGVAAGVVVGAAVAGCLVATAGICAGVAAPVVASLAAGGASTIAAGAFVGGASAAAGAATTYAITGDDGQGGSYSWDGASNYIGTQGLYGMGFGGAFGAFSLLGRTATTASRGAAGPGVWGTANESMSARAAAFQTQVTGRASGSVYRVNGVKFDGFANGVLQEAKGPGYAIGVRNGVFQPWYRGADDLANQAQRQLAAADGTPITWSVAEEEVVTAINNLFMSRGISGIKVVHVPPAG
jgi:hypothetical protein